MARAVLFSRTPWSALWAACRRKTPCRFPLPLTLRLRPFPYLSIRSAGPPHFEQRESRSPRPVTYLADSCGQVTRGEFLNGSWRRV